MLEPEGQHYLEIPYRTPSHPAITLWEQRQALARLRQLGRDQVDEAALFRMIRQVRDIVDTTQRSTRKARRDAQRRQHLKPQTPLSSLTPPLDTPVPGNPGLGNPNIRDTFFTWGNRNIQGMTVN